MTWPPVAKVPPSSSASRRYAATRSRWAAEITGPQMAPGSAGSLAPIDSMVVAATCTASSYLSRGTTSRVVIAHPWPAWMQAANAVAPATAATSASSSAIAADLPPSSRKTRFRVGAAAAMIARPVAVEPVNDTMSTRGSVTSIAATCVVPRGDHVEHPRWQVGVLGGQPAELARQPRCVRRRLEHDRAAGRQRRADLGQVDLGRDVPGRDRGDDTDRLAAYRPPARDPHRRRDAEVGLVVVGLGEVGDPAQPLDRSIEAGRDLHELRHPHLGGGQRPEVVGVVEQRLVQLAQAAHPQLDVRRPVGLVEGPPRGCDSRLDVVRGRVGRLTDLRTGGRVEDRVRPAVARADQLAVDQQLGCRHRHEVASWVMKSPRSTGGGHSVDGSSS